MSVRSLKAGPLWLVLLFDITPSIVGRADPQNAKMYAASLADLLFPGVAGVFPLLLVIMRPTLGITFAISFFAFPSFPDTNPASKCIMCSTGNWTPRPIDNSSTGCFSITPSSIVGENLPDSLDRLLLYLRQTGATVDFQHISSLLCSIRLFQRLHL